MNNKFQFYWTHLEVKRNWKEADRAIPLFDFLFVPIAFDLISGGRQLTTGQSTQVHT